MNGRHITYPRWLIVTLAAAILLLAAAGTWHYRGEEERIRRKAGNQLASIARFKEAKITAWRRERLADAAILMKGPFIAEGISRFIRDRDEQASRLLRVHFGNLQDHYGYADVLLADVDGRILFRLGEETAGNGEFVDWIKRALRERQPVLTELHVGPLRRKPHISAIAPIFSGPQPQAEPLGAVVLVSDAEQFLEPLTQFWPVPSDTAESLLCRPDDGHVQFLGGTRHQPDAELSIRISLDQTDLVEVRAALGHEGGVEARDYRGAKVMAYVTRIPDSSWIKVAKQDKDEIFAHWRFRSRLILGSFAALGGLVAAAGLIGWYRRDREQYRSLYLAEARLRAAAEEHSITLKSIGDAVIATDVDGAVVLMNPVAEELTGWTEEEAGGRPLEDVFHIINEYSRQRVDNPVTRVLREGAVVGLANHTILIARDGTEHPIADSAAPIRGAKDGASGVVLVFRDQTTEQNYRSLFRGMTGALAVHETVCDDAGQPVDFRFQAVNPAFERLTGIRARDVVGRTAAEVFPATESRWIERYGQVALTGEPEDFEAYYEELGKHLRVTVFRFAPRQFATIFQDITERKRGEEQQKRLTTAIEQSGEIVVITDPQEKIQFVNRAFEEITGYTRAEVLGKTPRLLKSGRQDDAFYREMWATLASGKTFKSRMVSRRKDGTFYTEDSTISPVMDSGGKTVNYVAVARDVTEQLQVEAELQQAQKMESIGRLAGGVAHDFNNMLSAIMGYAELAQGKLSPADPLHDELQEITSAARRSAEITEQLLAFASKQIIAPRIIDLNGTIDGMLKMLRRLIGENIKLRWRPARGKCVIEIDPAQLNQVLANLCINARDAIDDVGTISIETETTELDREYCRENPGSLPGRFVVLKISDTGHGMDSNTLSHLFEPFFTTKEVGKGTGLGLATVHGVVKQNGGFINVYSEVGHGTTFRLYLPHRPDDEQTGAGEDAGAPAGNGETVLLVEDEAAILRLGKVMLERLGYRVLAAASPGEALELAGGHDGGIDLLITDVVMPNMNGRDLADRLTEQEPDLKILFISGYTSNVIAHHGVLEKGVAFMQKPFSRQELARHVHAALHGPEDSRRAGG